MADLTTDAASWIRAAANALLAIRAVTPTLPDEDQTRDVNFLADTLSSIRISDTSSSRFDDLHTPIELARVERTAQRLLLGIPTDQANHP